MACWSQRVGMYAQRSPSLGPTRIRPSTPRISPLRVRAAEGALSGFSSWAARFPTWPGEVTSLAPGCVFTTGEDGKKRLLWGILAKDGDVGGGEELSAGVASGTAQLARECRGVAVPCLRPITQTPGGAHPQSGQGSHSQGPCVRYCKPTLSHADQIILREIGLRLHLWISHLQKHSSSRVGLHLVWHLCAVMPQLSYAPPPQLSLFLSLMKFPTFFCHFNHPHDFQPVLRTVIAHRCVMSAFVAITPRPLIVGGQIFPSFLICQRGREGRGGGTVCARINRKLHSVISQHALFAFTHYSNLHSVMTIC